MSKLIVESYEEELARLRTYSPKEFTGNVIWAERGLHNEPYSKLEQKENEE